MPHHQLLINLPLSFDILKLQAMQVSYIPIFGINLGVKIQSGNQTSFLLVTLIESVHTMEHRVCICIYSRINNENKNVSFAQNLAFIFLN